MKLILGIGGSGKTSLGKFLGRSKGLVAYKSKLFFMKNKKDKIGSNYLGYLNNFYHLLIPIFRSELYLHFSYLYCMSLIYQDIHSLSVSKKNSSIPHDCIQISVRSIRVYCFLKSMKADKEYILEIEKLFHRIGQIFEVGYVLKSDYNVHISRITKRNRILFIFDAPIMYGPQYEDIVFEASLRIASIVCKEVRTIDTTDFEEAKKQILL